MNWLRRFAGVVDRCTAKLASAVSWLALVMVVVTLLVVVLRYGFDVGAIALQESTIYMHGLIFLLGIPFGVQADSHVRVDILQARMSPGTRRWVELAGHVFFLLPVAGFILYSSLPYVGASWRVLEGSTRGGWHPGRIPAQDAAPAHGRHTVAPGPGPDHPSSSASRYGCASRRDRADTVSATPLLMFAATFAALLAGYPVALTLAGVALIFAFIGTMTGAFTPADLGFAPARLFGIVTNQTLIAVPLFVFMGVMLEKTRLAEGLLSNLAYLLRRFRGGLAITVVLVGMLMAASTGIVGATVVTMGLMSLPSMLRAGYDPSFATGTISATGTLGQIIPPSISLVLLGDVLSNAYQQAQLNMGVFAPKSVSVGDLFAGSLIPGLCLVGMYLVYVLITQRTRREAHPSADPEEEDGPGLLQTLGSLFPPLFLIGAVLGSILGGWATPTEAAGVGASGALLLGLWYRRCDWPTLKAVCESTLSTTAMVFFILIGASIFSLVFRGYGGDEMVQAWFEQMPGGMWGALAVVMLVIFVLGFILDFIEITFVVVPIVGPVLLAMGIDPIWLGVLIAVNLQTSFLTPPFGFALFYLRGVTPPEVPTSAIYKGVVPYIVLQLVMLAILLYQPALATWLPNLVYGSG